MNLLKNILFCIFFLFLFTVKSQTDTTNSVNNKRLILLLSSETIAYSSTIVGLNILWYKDYDHSSFHFFNDNKEWLQIDKVGHFYTSYYLNNILSSGFEWSGIEKNKSVLYGGGLSFIFISTIEIFDGFSEKWGASWSDMIANTGGIILYAGQEKLWSEQRIIPKFSFTRSTIYSCRPDALGVNLIENIFKDYNGQTYWLSGNINSFLKIDGFPNWLNIAFGYGAENMLGGMDNSNLGCCDFVIPLERYRQYYFSLDIDLRKIKTNSKILGTCFQIFNSVKVPFPTIEINKYRIRFHPLFF